MRHPFLRTLAGSAATPTDPNFENVTLLLHGDGTNGGQNNTFVDGSTNNFTITRNGNTTQGTFSPYGDNWSNFFDGTDDYLSIADNANLRAGAGTFTIEAWIYRNATGAAHTIYAKGGASTGIVLQVTSTNVLRFTHTTTNIDSTGTIALATWTHVAVVREGTGTNETKLYINGTQDGAGTVSTDFTQTEEVRIGTDRSAAADFNGYISNLRFVKGTAVYTGAFTVPTSPLTAISNTQLLTCKSNRFRDESANAFTVTRNNNASVQRFSPFSPTAAYAAGTIGGSGYFDGTGDYLTVGGGMPSGQGTAFTMECWIYCTSLGKVITRGDTAPRFDLGISSAGAIVLDNVATVNICTSATGVIKASNWHHVAVTRSTANIYRIWVDGVVVATSATFSTNMSANTTIGYSAFSATVLFTGYLSDFRVVSSEVYTATFTPPTAPLTAITNTSLLLNFTNAAILDNAMMAVPETVGNAQISTSVKKYGTGSLYFDGNGDYLSIKDSVDLNMTTGNFTIEAWVRASATSTQSQMILSKDGQFGVAYAQYVIAFSPSRKIDAAVGSGNGTSYTQAISSTTVLSLDVWYHVAFVKSGTTLTLYINGTSEASATQTGTMTTGNRPLLIGWEQGQPVQQYFNGYIDDLRITKGVARYTSNFTAPTAAFPDL